MSGDEKVRELQRMQKRMDRLFDSMLPTLGWAAIHQQRVWQPATDVYETQEAVVVKVEIAGMAEEDLHVSLANRTLQVSGVRRDLECKQSYQQLEIPYGPFSTEVFLPYAVDRDGIHARYENGFLTVVLPKADTRQVQVTGKTAEEE